jgi:hypothetical protein
MWKWTKRLAMGLAAAVAAGLFFFGTDVFSYGSSSVRMLKKAVSDSVPVEFEIKRSRDLLDELIPEMHANIKLVAQEEVGVSNLEKELERERQALETERGRIQTLRDSLSGAEVSHRFGNRSYSRAQVLEELARRFEHFRTAELLIAGKEKLLENRRAALDAGIKKLEKTRLARLELAAQIESLEGQFRLIQAQSAGGEFRLDDSKLAQTERLLSSLRSRLEVAQRVLAREARFIEQIPVDGVHEESLIDSVDRHFAGAKAAALEY